MRTRSALLGASVCVLLSVLAAAPAPQARAAEVPGEVKLSLERYEKLMKAAQRTDGPRATWARGSVSVDLPGEGESFARVTVSASARVVGDGLAEVPLVPGDVVLEQVTVNGSNATLMRRGGLQVVVVDENTRSLNVRLTYLVPAQMSSSGSRVAVVPLPPMPSSSYSVSGGGDEIDVWPSAGEPGRTSGSLPATVAMVVRFGAGAAGQQIRSASYEVKPDASGDGVEVEATFEVVVDTARAWVRLASSDVALLEVREGGRALVTRVAEGWHRASVSGAGTHTIVMKFRQLIDRTKGQPEVQLKLAEAPITRVQASVAGKRKIEFTPQVPVFTTVTGEDDKALTTAVANLPPVDDVTLRWTEARAKPEDERKVNAETYQLISIEEGVIRSKVHIRYDIIKGEAKEFAIAIPEGVVLYKASGDQIEQWPVYAATDEAPRQARVILGRDRSGRYDLMLELQQSLPKNAKSVQLPIVKPLDVAYQTGAVALFDGDKVGFGQAKLPETYTRGGENDLPTDLRQTLTDKPGQVFRHIDAPAAITAPVEEAKVRDVRYDAKVDALYLVKEGVLVGNASVLVEIKTGRRDNLLVTLPTGKVKPLNWNFPSKAKDPEVVESEEAGEGRTAYELRFTQALEGAIQIDVEFEMLLDKDQAELNLPSLHVLGADVESGALGIVAETGIEVTAGTATDLRRVDAKELPKSIRLRSEREILLAYTYSRAPWSLQLGVKRHEVIETLKAIAVAVWFDTTIFEDGHVKTAATFRVVNEHQQYLRLTMPEGSKVLKVYRGDSAIKANRDAGALTIPLPKEQETVVTVVYEVAEEGDLGFFGGLTLAAPGADLRLSDIQWRVRIPKELAIFGVDTELDEGQSGEWRGPEGYLAPGVSLLTSLSNEGDYTARLFTSPERRMEQSAVAIDINYASTPGSWTGVLLSLLALLLLAFVVRRRVMHEPLGLSGWIALVIGVGALVLKAFSWGLGTGEALTGVAVLVAVALLSLRARDKA